MTDEQMNSEMAALDPDWYMDDYDWSHDACQRVIDGFKASELSDYFRELRRTCGCTTMANIEVMLKATPRQKREAILKAKGLWNDS